IMADTVKFFFSSRRRHTRLQGDWSSDVCSSDLNEDYWLVRKDTDHLVILSAAKNLAACGQILRRTQHDNRANCQARELSASVVLTLRVRKFVTRSVTTTLPDMDRPTEH